MIRDKACGMRGMVAHVCVYVNVGAVGSCLRENYGQEQLPCQRQFCQADAPDACLDDARVASKPAAVGLYSGVLRI